MSVRIAIIGAGIMGADHARIFAEMISGTELRLICDADERRARRVADGLGVPHVLTDAEEVISRSDIDAVVIASPDLTHARLTVACIRAGKPVLCEKPLSHSPTECLEVIETEVSGGKRFVQLGFMRRFDQAYIEMRQALTQENLAGRL